MIVLLWVIILIVENWRENVLTRMHKLLTLLRLLELVIIHIYIVKKHILLLLDWYWKVLNLIINNWV